MDSSTPHDTWFHFAHRHTRHAEALLRAILPAPLTAALDWSTLRPGPERVHGLALRLGFTDLVYEVQLCATHRRVFVVIEHRSYRDAGLHDQVLRYGVHLAHALRAQSWSPRTPVIAVVVYHGPGAPELRPDLSGFGPDVQALLEPLQPRIACITDHLSARTEAEILARDLTPLGKLTHLSLRFLPHSDPGETLRALERWAPVLRAVDIDDGPPVGREAIATFGWYLLHVTETAVEDVHMALEKHLQREEHTFMSTAEQLRREGREQGVSEGRTEGRTEGRAETLLRLLTRRFGPLPPTIEPRLRAATNADLDRWTDRILDCPTLDAIFAVE